MQIYAVFAAVVIIPVAFVVFGALPRAASAIGGQHEPLGAAVLGLRPRRAFASLCLASFLCCVPMAMRQGHLVAFCSDVGIPVTRRQRDVVVLLAFGFIGRQLLGFHRRPDRRTADGARRLGLPGHCNDRVFADSERSRPVRRFCCVRSGFQRDHSGLCAGTPRALPVGEASWRVPTLLLCSGSGVAAGAIYDYAGRPPLPPASSLTSPICWSSARRCSATAGFIHCCSCEDRHSQITVRSCGPWLAP